MGLCSGRCTSTARLDGKTAIITGSNTGIGKFTALDLYRRGCRVIMACRNQEKALEAKNEIIQKCVGVDNVGYLLIRRLDLSSLTSVREFSSQILSEENVINILINNAGIMACPKSFTEDGFEMQFGTNHLGHFLLTLLLLPKIVASAPSRIVNLSSLMHKRVGRWDWNNLNAEKSYSPIGNYSMSKLANVLFTKELAARLKDRNVQVYAVHPGIVNTEISRYGDSLLFPGATCLYQTVGACFQKSAEQGAQTSIYCAVDEEAGMETGQYYSDCKLAAVAPEANDTAMAKRLWDVSISMVQLKNYDPFNIHVNVAPTSQEVVET